MTRFTLLSLALVATLCAVAPGHVAGQDQAEPVEVVNFPEVQAVSGRVEIVGPVTQTRLERLAEAVVSPASPDRTTELVLAGTLDSAGFGDAVLSLTGQLRAAFSQAGKIGAILIPDVEIARTAFLEEGELLFPLRVEAQAGKEAAYFSSDQPSFRLGFDRYLVYFYNTTDRPATVELFAYLGN